MPLIVPQVPTTAYTRSFLTSANAAAARASLGVGTSTDMVFSGSTSPEGVVAAPVGAIYQQIIAGVLDKQWTKTTGGSTSSGWS